MLRVVSSLCRRPPAVFGQSALFTSDGGSLRSKYDCVIVGAGHNGLVSAAYLAMAGKKVAVLERRGLIGGAAVTEEIVPGFRFSRASYLLSLMPPHIIEELKLKENGLKLYLRDPSSYTPLLKPENGHSSFTLHRDPAKTLAEVAKFSKRDAGRYAAYEEMLEDICKVVTKLCDAPAIPIDKIGDMKGTMEKIKAILKYKKPLGSLKDVASYETFYEVLTAPISKILNQWFDSDVIKATFATDGMIGAPLGPHTTGSSYVLLHHVMGGQEGVPGAWAYVEGGMGGVSKALGKSCAALGVDIHTNAEVKSIDTHGSKVAGVTLCDGRHVEAEYVLSNATPCVTFTKLMTPSQLPEEFNRKVNAVSYESPVTKINVALKELPNFLANPHTRDVAPHHCTTIHMNCENMDVLQDAFVDYLQGRPSKKPMLEMVIPSVYDRTLITTETERPQHLADAPHVALLFTQFTPYRCAADADIGGAGWDDEARRAYAKRIFEQIDQYAPNFSGAVLDYEVLTPMDIENEFGLTGGNIFHGAMSLDQLYHSRIPAQSPIDGLLTCGSGTHPGGGVMGTPGRNAANIVLKKYL